MYRNHTARLGVLLLAILLGLQACSAPGQSTGATPGQPGPSGSESPAPEEVDPNSKFGFPKQAGLPLEVKPELRLLTAGEAASISAFTILNPTQCVSTLPTREPCRFTIVMSPLPQGVQVGTVLNSGVTQATPNGMLVKVTAISGTTLQGVEATIDEAIAQGEFRSERFFSPQDVKKVTTAPGVKPLSAVSPSPSRDGVRPPLGEAGPRNLLFQGNDFGFGWQLQDAEVADGVRMNGNLYFNFGCGIDFGITYKYWVIPTGVRFATQCGGAQGAQVTVTATGSAVVEKQYVVATIDLDNIVISTPYFTLVFVPTVIISVNARGEAKAAVTFSAQETVSAYAGLKFDKHGFAGNVAFTSDFSSGSGNKSLSVVLEGGINAGFKIMLYGLQGNQLNTYAGLVFETTYPRQPLWSLKLHAVLSASMNINLIIKELVWGPAAVFEQTFGIADAPNQPPDLALVGVKEGQTVYATGVGLFLPEITLTATDPEGQAVASVWGESSLDGPLGPMSNGVKRPLALQTPGDQKLTFSARDGEGATSSTSLTVHVVKPAPTVSLGVTDLNGNLVPTWTGTATGQQTTYLLIKATLKPGVAGGMTPACSEVTWDAGGLSFATDGTCVATLSLSKQGTYTIKVGAPGATAATLQVKVGAPPAKPLPQYGAISISSGGVVQNTNWVAYGGVSVSVKALAPLPTGFTPKYVWQLKLASAATWTNLTCLTSGRLTDPSTSGCQATVGAGQSYVVRVLIYDTSTSTTTAAVTKELTFQTRPKLA